MRDRGSPQARTPRRPVGPTAAAWLLLMAAIGAAPAAPDRGTTSSSATTPAADAAMSGDVSTFLRWVAQTGDNDGQPYIVIDKRQARLWLFDAVGRPHGNAPVLLGMARGDASVPGIGERPMAQIRPDERTTPAGRFIAEAGRNAAGEDIYWIDYDAAVSMHRVRPANAAEHRLQRLATPTPADNRISYGCINVPAAFYDREIRALFTPPRRGVVYLLPETMPLSALFSAAGRGAPPAVARR